MGFFTLALRTLQYYINMIKMYEFTCKYINNMDARGCWSDSYVEAILIPMALQLKEEV